MIERLIQALSAELVTLETTSSLIEDRIEAEVNYRLRETIGRLIQNLQAS